MKSRPASSPSFASARQSSQLADQRSGTKVAERPDEQLAPNSPILSALSLYMAMRDCIDAAGASTVSSSRKSSSCRPYNRFRRKGADPAVGQLSLRGISRRYRYLTPP